MTTTNYTDPWRDHTFSVHVEGDTVSQYGTPFTWLVPTLLPFYSCSLLVTDNPFQGADLVKALITAATVGGTFLGHSVTPAQPFIALPSKDQEAHARRWLTTHPHALVIVQDIAVGIDSSDHRVIAEHLNRWRHLAAQHDAHIMATLSTAFDVYPASTWAALLGREVDTTLLIDGGFVEVRQSRSGTPIPRTPLADLLAVQQ